MENKNLKYIRDTVCTTINVSVREVEGKTRKPEVVLARKLYTYFAYKYLYYIDAKTYSKTKILEYIGKERSMYYHYAKEVNNIKDTNRDSMYFLKRLKETFRKGFLTDLSNNRDISCIDIDISTTALLDALNMNLDELMSRMYSRKDQVEEIVTKTKEHYIENLLKILK